MGQRAPLQPGGPPGGRLPGGRTGAEPGAHPRRLGRRADRDRPPVADLQATERGQRLQLPRGAAFAALLSGLPVRLGPGHRPRGWRHEGVLALPHDLGFGVPTLPAPVHAPRRPGRQRQPVLPAVDGDPRQPRARLPRSIGVDTMTRFLALSLVLAAGLLAVSATGADKLKVVTTIPDLADMTRQIGGDQVDVTSLATGVEDIHAVPMKPSFAVTLNRADAVVLLGLEAEP